MAIVFASLLPLANREPCPDIDLHTNIATYTEYEQIVLQAESHESSASSSVLKQIDIECSKTTDNVSCSVVCLMQSPILCAIIGMPLEENLTQVKKKIFYSLGEVSVAPTQLNSPMMCLV